MKNYSISNKDLVTFLIVTFGLTILMGFAMYIAYPTYSVDSFPLVQMYYPALGAMVALLLNKDLSKEIPKNFFSAYIFFVISSVCYLLIKLFIFHQDPSIDLEIGILIGSIILFIAYKLDEKEKIERFGFSSKKSFKGSIPYVILFILLYLSCILIASLVTGEVNRIIDPFKSLRTWVRLLLLPLSFLLSYPAFLGEEYGWRYFLQSALQERMGKRKGVLILGLLWGIWHLSINLFYYSPQTSFYSVLNQLIVCVSYSIFFGYVYMRTENIWIISMIHFFNNNLGFVLFGATGANVVFSWQAIVFNLILFSIVYAPFLLANDYRNQSYLKTNAEE